MTRMGGNVQIFFVLAIIVLVLAICFGGCISSPTVPATVAGPGSGLVAGDEIRWLPEYPGWVLVREDIYVRLLEDKAAAEEELRVYWRNEGIGSPR